MSSPVVSASALAVVTLFMIVAMVTLGNHSASAPQGSLAVASQTTHIDG